MSGTPRWWVPELAVVIGIPAVAVLGGLLTLHVSAVDLSDDGAHTSARGNSQVQSADVTADLAAARARLSAQLQVDRARGEVSVRMPGKLDAQEPLELVFVHSLHAREDLRARLQPRDGAWVAPLAPAADSRWRVVLADSRHSWRLVGTLPRDAAALSLQPALAAP